MCTITLRRVHFRILDRTKHLLANMEKMKGSYTFSSDGSTSSDGFWLTWRRSRGATLSQVMAALVVMDFDEEMAKEWSRHLGDSGRNP